MTKTRTIKLMADYYASPVWECLPGSVHNVEPKSLPISSGLQQRLGEWAASYDATLDMNQPMQSGFKSRQAEEKFKEIGNELGKQLRQELGKSFEVKVVE